MSDAAQQSVAAHAPPDIGGNALLNIIEWIIAPERLLRRGLRQCGPTFTVSLFGSDKLLLVGEPSLLKQIDRMPDAILSARDGNDLMVRLLGEKSLFLQDGAEHDERRTLIRDALQEVTLARLQECHVRRATLALDEISKIRRPVALHPILKRLSLETVCDLTFGEQWPDLNRLEVALGPVTGLLSTVFAYIAPLRKKIGPVDMEKIADRRVAAVDEIMFEAIARARENPDASGALGAIVRIAAKRGLVIDDAELRDQALSIVLAGYETTACAIAWAIEHCFSDFRQAARLRDPGDNGTPDKAIISAAFIESQRLSPTVESFARGARKDLVLGGYHVAKGTLVAPCAYLAQRVAFPIDPDRFDLERILASRPRYAEFLPFGLSSRYCLGARVATMQAEEIMRLLATRYTVRLGKARLPTALRRNVVLAPRGRTRARIELAASD